MPLEICLVEPEIPANTGNIARTCVAIGAKLHLCGHLGFSIDDKRMKRAGLDYWFDLDLQLWDSIDELLSATKQQVFYATTKAHQTYSSVHYPEDSLLVFGKETKGLPESLLSVHPERCVRLPMREEYRSLNLSNAVAVMSYEYLRQHDFKGLQIKSDFIL